jgi:DTW domain-containing protein YfiP
MTRAYCYQCNKAKQACICNLIPSIYNRVNIYVLQHPSEAKQAKGSAVIAKLYLQNYQCLTGEDFSGNPLLNVLIQDHAESTFVVYPSESALSLDNCLDEAIKKGQHEANLSNVNLIFIDATWPKAHKIWRLSPNLHALSCIALNLEKQSNYRIRKAPKDNSLSTIEAIVACLGYLENNMDKYQPLIEVFNKMIDFQINKMGDEVYQRNYIE